MEDLHSYGWYAKRVAKYMPKGVFKPVPKRLWGGLAYLSIIISGLLIISLTEWHPLFFLPISFILGASFAGMGFLGHEILHGTVVKKPWLRDLLGAIAFWPLSTGPKLWRKWHNLNHHIHTQHEDNDPDAWPSLERLSQSKMFHWIYKLPLFVRAFFAFASLAVQFTAHSLKMFCAYIKDFKPKQQPKVWIQMALPWASWIGLLFLIGWEKWLFAFFIPLLVANLVVMGYISTNHRLNPLVPVNDPLANSLTVTVPKWVDYIHFNFSHHTEHHLFPGMSSKHYPLVKYYIKQLWPEKYHEMAMSKALIALWKTPRVYFDNRELIDPSHGHLYGSLGHGLNPENIDYKKMNN
ncbi:fatty acid desaturase family protein [Halobacillus seohaensis]|uniref:Fatty acid desaturase family protein n=1 Tax=Halobacillus seohaensis TaxID=447421 RepID=A0ABW2EJT8_9BACI